MLLYKVYYYKLPCTHIRQDTNLLVNITLNLRNHCSLALFQKCTQLLKRLINFIFRPFSGILDLSAETISVELYCLNLFNTGA